MPLHRLLQADRALGRRRWRRERQSEPPAVPRLRQARGAVPVRPPRRARGAEPEQVAPSGCSADRGREGREQEPELRGSLKREQRASGGCI